MCETEVETTDKENEKVIESSNDVESQTNDAIVAVESLEIMSIFPSIFRQMLKITKDHSQGRLI